MATVGVLDVGLVAAGSLAVALLADELVALAVEASLADVLLPVDPLPGCALLDVAVPVVALTGATPATGLAAVDGLLVPLTAFRKF